MKNRRRRRQMEPRQVFLLFESLGPLFFPLAIRIGMDCDVEKDSLGEMEWVTSLSRVVSLSLFLAFIFDVLFHLFPSLKLIKNDASFSPLIPVTNSKQNEEETHNWCGLPFPKKKEKKKKFPVESL